jgi:hypothetical protein
LVTDALHFDLRHLRTANALNRFGKLQLVEFFTVKIACQSALVANKMMVTAKVGIEAGSRAPGSQGFDESKIFQPPERPVYRIERNGRYPSAYTPEHCFCVRVVRALGHFAKNLQALMGHFGTRLSAFFPEAGYAFFDFPPGMFHRRSY